MEQEFVSYEQAAELKKLGFDKPCLVKFVVPGDLVLPGTYENTYVGSAAITQNDICEAHILAPTKSQIFRWFREKYGWYVNIISWIREEGVEVYHEYETYGTPYSDYLSDEYPTYEEAENACIDKLIELAKEQDK